MLSFRLLAPLLAAGMAFAATGLGPGTALAEGPDACADTIAVERGDTLRRIAERCGVSVDALIAANDEITDPNLLRVGMLLTTPGADNDDWNAAGGEVEAQPGDTLASIAERHGVPLGILMATNPDLHPEELDPGTLVGLPDG